MKIEGCTLRVNSHSSGVEVFIVNEEQGVNTVLHLPLGMNVDPNEPLEFVPALAAVTASNDVIG